ncbi:MAG TPA: hypothetical protein VLZ30_12395 [Verrucomicrobiae bacterium]|nr:hypothetical protein [Verrucomicrobiae bacterium]
MMKRAIRITSAEKVVRQISELRDLARRLAKAGFKAGLHDRDPSRLLASNKVAETSGKYTTRGGRNSNQRVRQSRST